MMLSPCSGARYRELVWRRLRQRMNLVWSLDYRPFTYSHTRPEQNIYYCQEKLSCVCFVFYYVTRGWGTKVTIE